MSKKQASKLTPRERLERDLLESIELRKMPLGSEARTAAIRRIVKRKHQLSERDLVKRHEAWLAMGSPDLRSPEWLAKLQELRRPRLGRQQSVPPRDEAELHRRMKTLLGRQMADKMAGRAFEPVKLPGQFLEGQSKEQRAEAARLYRWLWRHYPGLLRACDDELRDLIRQAGGLA